jgi:hypothetical protein
MPTDGRTDRRTNMTKVIVAFLNFSNASKMIYGFGIVYALGVHNLTYKVAADST